MTIKEMKAKLGELQTRREELKAKKEIAALPDAEAREYIAILDEQETILASIKTAEREAAVDAVATAAQPVPRLVIAGGPVAETAAYSLGEYLQDIFKMSTGRNPGARFESKQTQFKAAATGLSEGIPSDGGFLVGSDMVTSLMTKVYEGNDIASRCSRAPISANSNAMTMNGVNESSRANGSRFGGVQGYWEDEADEITASKPKFNQINLKLKKVTAAYYATDEVLADAPFLQAQVNEMVSAELAFKLSDALVRGSGAGRPQGYLSSPALVTVAKQTGQGADTVKWENVRDMYSRMWAASRRNAIWIANDETLPQLMDMVKLTGTSGVAVWLPANQAINQPYDVLLGRPIIYAEQASALGDVGDISFVDLSQIQLIDKGGIQGASSIHVKFLQSEQVFKFVYRVDAQSKWASALTPYKGAGTKSPFVTLAERA